MPTVLRLDGLRVVIYLNDHRPAHVHVIGADREAVFNLHCPDGPPELRSNYGFAYRDVNGIGGDVAQVLPLLCEKWRNFHGRY